MKRSSKSIPVKGLPVKRHLHHHIKLAIIPHSANNYLPHLIRHYGIIALLIVVLSMQFTYNVSRTGSVLGIKANVTATTLLSDANDERRSDNLPPLQYNDQLAAAAYYKAKDMFSHQYWSHTAPDGTTPWAWFKKVGYKYSYAGENLAKNFSSADAVTTAWMASPKHRANIMNEQFTDVGYAVVEGVLNGKETTLIVSLFGAPVGPAEVAGISAPETSTSPTSGNMSIMTRFGIALQSLTPAALGSIILIIFAALVALLAHAYRRKLPRAWQRSWRLHHGLIKAGGMISLSIVMVFLYSGGQV